MHGGAFLRVCGEGCGAEEVLTCLVVVSGAAVEVSRDGGQEVVVPQRWEIE